MDKWNRNYQLLIERRDGSFTEIRPPFTIEFDIRRGMNSSVNGAHIKVYNLSETTRQDINKSAIEWSVLKRVILNAGYGDKLAKIFDGNVTEASSVRSGTNVITSIECYDGAFAFVNSFCSRTYKEGTTYNSMLQDLMDQLPGVSVGAVGTFDETLKRGNTLSGNTVDIINQFSGNRFFIDNGRAFCLGEDECIEGQIRTINSKSGLLGTPRVEGAQLFLDMLFEPAILIGQEISLESETLKQYNTHYKIASVEHRGTISSSISGDIITTLGMYTGARSLTIVPLRSG